MRARASFAAAVTAAALVAAPVLATGGSSEAGGKAWKARPATYGIAKQTDVPVKMDDGVVLRADILRPAAADGSPAKGRFPVILTQTPYNKAGKGTNFQNDYLVQRGYIQVIVDVRGTGSSEGQWTSFGEREQRDYCRTAAWAVKVPGSNGRMGLYGISYGAITQLYPAACHPKGLKAIFPIVPLGDSYRDVTVSGGHTDTGFMPFWLGLVTGTAMLPASARTDPASAGKAVADHVQGAANFQATTLASASLGRELNGVDAAYDGPFYRTRSPLEIIEKVDVPTFIVGGIYDLFQRGEPMLYNALRARGVPSRLLIGPWTHLDASGLGTGLPADGVPTLEELELRWFDRYVRGVKDASLDSDIAPVTLFRLGADRFERATAYPPAGTRYRELRLPTGTVDVPYMPVAGACSVSSSQWTAGIAPAGQRLCTGDHRFNDKMGAVIDFPVRGKALRFAGTSAARLFVSTTRADAFVTARLEDVAPDGTSTPLSNGWQLLSLRKLDRSKSLFRNGLLVQPWHPDTRASVLPVEAGSVYRLDVEIFPTAARIPAGHVLRLAIQTNDEPHATPSTPTAINEMGGILTIHSSKRYPSALILGKQR